MITSAAAARRHGADEREEREQREERMMNAAQGNANGLFRLAFVSTGGAWLGWRPKPTWMVLHDGRPTLTI